MNCLVNLFDCGMADSVRSTVTVEIMLPGRFRLLVERGTVGGTVEDSRWQMVRMRQLLSAVEPTTEKLSDQFCKNTWANKLELALRCKITFGR